MHCRGGQADRGWRRAHGQALTCRRGAPHSEALDGRGGLILMTANASPKRGLQEPALQALLRAIAARDRSMTSRLLAESPLLARQAIAVGATREAASPYFEQIAHYVYAGDTPLHVAAAAYQPAIAQELVSKGANVAARNRRGAEPLHYAADGIPGSDAWDPDSQYAIVRFLIGAGASPNAKDKSGVAPLHRAVRTRCAAAVRALLMNGADALERNKSGSTPCISRSRIPDAAAAELRRRVNNRRRSSGCFSGTALARRTRTPLAGP
jgi:hypothetical protein